MPTRNTRFVGRPPKIVSLELARERVLRSASKQREGHRWIGGMISVEARRELDFLRDHWAARSNMEIVQAALGYLAECTREGYVVRETPGLESLP